MADEQNVVIVSDTKIHMPLICDDKERRVAVTVALELIKATCAGQGHRILRTALGELSDHADKIQAALKKK